MIRWRLIYIVPVCDTTYHFFATLLTLIGLQYINSQTYSTSIQKYYHLVIKTKRQKPIYHTNSQQTNNTVTLNVPVEDRNTSNYLYKVNSILIQTWNNNNNNSNNNNNNNNNNVTCSHLGSLSLFNIFVRFKIGSNTVSYRLPNSVYQLTEQELALEVAFNEFTSGEVQVSDIGSCMNTL